MQAVLILFLVCLTVVVDHSSAHYYGGWYWRWRCDPCSTTRCPYIGQKCFLVPDPACTTPPCPVKPTCLVDPSYDPCSIGQPMADAAGTHFTCTATTPCPQDGKCVINNIGGTSVSKCCLDPDKCPVKAGSCPYSSDTTTCTNTCTDDGDCTSTMKCCTTACFGKKCMAPMNWWW